jgi:hypothetical protein
MRPLLAAVFAAMLAASGCQNMPDPYPPPEQRPAAESFVPLRLQAVVDMGDADSGRHFVQDITGLDGGTWRWSGKRPTVRVKAHTTENLRYTIDFAIADATLKVTGPVTVTFLVNDRVLDKAHYDHAGNQHFEKAIPAGWVTAGQDVTVGAEIDKVWTPPDKGPVLGMVLVRIGIMQ